MYYILFVNKVLAQYFDNAPDITSCKRFVNNTTGVCTCYIIKKEYSIVLDNVYKPRKYNIFIVKQHIVMIIS